MNNSVYTLKLCYTSDTAQTFKELATQALVEKLSVHGIDCSQVSASRIVFENEQDRTFAVLLLDNREFVLETQQ